jgi:hypothetical protein
MTQELLDMRGIKLDLQKEAYDTSWSLSSTLCHLYSEIITLRQWYFAQVRYSRAERMFSVRSSSGRRSIARALLASTWLLRSSSWQCFGSVTLWYGSGSADSYNWITNSDPDPTLFFSCFQQDARRIGTIFAFFLLIFYQWKISSLLHMVLKSRK